MTKENICSTCKKPLNVKGRPSTKDLGGDCLFCMALAGDPNALMILHSEVEVLESLYDKVKAWRETRREVIDTRHAHTKHGLDAHLVAEKAFSDAETNLLCAQSVASAALETLL